MRGDLVLAALEYEAFRGRYLEAFIELNKPGGN
jgi:hypothetical protein